MVLSIELPDIFTISELNDAYLKEALVATLYHVGKLSEKESCVALGKTRREFEELLPKFGFSILGDSQESINIELNA
jgi:hypothetical protein